jgi:hypothetical protein
MDQHRLVAALVVIALAPPAAWVAWISGAGGYASDTRTVLWFATVALGALLAGVVAPRGRQAWLSLWPVGLLSSLVTLWRWWSSEDDSGLFVVGLIIATPLVALAGMALVALGQRLARR